MIKFLALTSDLLAGITMTFLSFFELAGPRQNLATKSPLKMMKNAFYFTLKALFAVRIFKFLS